jgi:hypothetical protein
MMFNYYLQFFMLFASFVASHVTKHKPSFSPTPCPTNSNATIVGCVELPSCGSMCNLAQFGIVIGPLFLLVCLFFVIAQNEQRICAWWRGLPSLGEMLGDFHYWIRQKLCPMAKNEELGTDVGDEIHIVSGQNEQGCCAWWRGLPSLGEMLRDFYYWIRQKLFGPMANDVQPDSEETA